MNLIFFLLSISLLAQPPATILVIDTYLREDVGAINDFTQEQYFKKKFPIYSSDLEKVVAAAEEAAQLLNRGTTCYKSDTIQANRTTFIIHTNCERNKEVTVQLITTIEGRYTSFDFELVRKEDNMRKAQRRILDFAMYLEK